MSKIKILTGDYFKLFVKREEKVVLGRHYSNLWLLTAVLTLTFLAIAFSSASLNYLSYKMNDPFINWVDIQNEYGEGDIDGLLDGLSDTNNMKQFHFVAHQVDYTFNFNVFGKEEKQIQYPDFRFFQSFAGNPLLKSVLDRENVVDKCALSFESLSDDMIGVIVTYDFIKKLGYDDDFPAYLDMCRYGGSADTLGFPLFQGFAHVPVPIIAVVKRLPMNMDIIATKYFYEQLRNDLTYPFLLDNRKYAITLNYFVPSDIPETEFKEYIRSIGGELVFVPKQAPYLPLLRTFKPGYYVKVTGAYDDLTPQFVTSLHNKVVEKYGEYDIHRVYDYNFKPYQLPQGSYISIQFADLNNIRAFESFVKDTYRVQIEMEQINAKENFNAVSVMANILSWAIIVFSILCIMLFVVNLLQSYFQKVKRNLGTFKAFGIGNFELISVYVLIMISTIAGAIGLALAISYTIELILPLCGIMKDGAFSYLALWSPKTFYSIAVIMICSIATVYMVMKRLLSATPGDLIYDRQ